LHAMSLAMAWFMLPGMVVILGPRLSRVAYSLVAPVAVRVLDSSPIAVLLSQSGILPRGPLVEVVLRMIALQLAASAALLAWAIVRLRPASRAVYDVEAKAASRRLFRVKWRPRPPCGDDPVLWHEMHTGRMISKPSLWADRMCNALWFGLLIYELSWFAL